MAISVKIVPGSDDVWGRTRTVVANITLDNSYPAGGYAFPLSALGFTNMTDAILNDGIAGTVANSGGLDYGMDFTSAAAPKLRVFYPTGGGAASPAALAAPAITAGAVAMTSTAANGAADLTPGLGKEVATSTDLSTVVLRGRFFSL